MPRFLLLLLAVACSTPSAVCDAGRQEACACPGGAEGAQVCAADGSSWGTCDCDATADTDVAGDTDVADTDPPVCAELAVCDDCLSCSWEGDTCATEWAACASDGACPATAACMKACDAEDDACRTQCINQAAGGEQLATDAITCSQLECASACEG